jgi:hypothetical protein
MIVASCSGMPVSATVLPNHVDHLRFDTRSYRARSCCPFPLEGGVGGRVVLFSRKEKKKKQKKKKRKKKKKKKNKTTRIAQFTPRADSENRQRPAL